MSISYLSQDGILQWAPWLWVIQAYQWTHDQGRPVPPLTPRWRSESCDLDRHALILIQAWRPDASHLQSLATPFQDQMHYIWQEPRLTAWLRRLRDPQTPRATRRLMAHAYAHWFRAVQERIQAQDTDWLIIRFHHDTVSWAVDFGNYADYWEDSALMRLVHFLQSLAEILDTVPAPPDPDAWHPPTPRTLIDLLDSEEASS
jgi:hypothetical protein